MGGSRERLDDNPLLWFVYFLYDDVCSERESAVLTLWKRETWSYGLTSFKKDEDKTSKTRSALLESNNYSSQEPLPVTTSHGICCFIRAGPRLLVDLSKMSFVAPKLS